MYNALLAILRFQADKMIGAVKASDCKLRSTNLCSWCRVVPRVITGLVIACRPSGPRSCGAKCSLVRKSRNSVVIWLNCAVKKPISAGSAGSVVGGARVGTDTLGSDCSSSSPSLCVSWCPSGTTVDGAPEEALDNSSEELSTICRRRIGERSRAVGCGR